MENFVPVGTKIKRGGEMAHWGVGNWDKVGSWEMENGDWEVGQGLSQGQEIENLYVVRHRKWNI